MELDDLKNLWNAKGIRGTKRQFTEEELAEMLNKRITDSQKQIEKRIWQEAVCCIGVALLLGIIYVSDRDHYNKIISTGILVFIFLFLITCGIILIYSNKVIGKGFVHLNMKDASGNMLRHYRKIENWYLYSSTIFCALLFAALLYSDAFAKTASLGIIAKIGLWILLSATVHLFNVFYIKKRFGSKIKELEKLNKEFN